MQASVIHPRSMAYAQDRNPSSCMKASAMDDRWADCTLPDAN